VALRHSSRQAEMASRVGRAFKPKLYNLASDAIVNEALLAGGHALPRPAVRAKELIELLHGDITVESELGVGTRFTIHLPRHPESETPDGATSGAAAHANGRENREGAHASAEIDPGE